MGAVSVNLTDAAYDIYVVWRDERLASRLVSKAIEKYAYQRVKPGDRRKHDDGEWYYWLEKGGWERVDK